ncbi:hypothetical protein [Dokdonella immobilis]|uniref:Glutathione S-transferase n=1 Tax=Dokdonella immobilis TaxID=578942 RepID=A0A1I4YUZ3_9GAMM|nr:hypothetical protein [Dokdonella immobilis]SFN41450.1 hypothetical protein SAMN05216289_12012 [Dokdonella immobilis]
MPVHYVSVEEAMQRDGLRMVVVGGVPSLWGEAAKGILHVKRLDWVAVRLVYDNEALTSWARQRSGPVLFHGDDEPRSRWDDILMLAERLAPAPALLPEEPGERALVLGLSHEICGEGGLGWSRRLQMVQASLQGQGGFPERVARYLGHKYGYGTEADRSCAARVGGKLRMLAARLRSQRAAGNAYLVGSTLSAADIYCATAMGMFDPLPPGQCDMDAALREAFALRDEATTAALDPVLLDHRERIYTEYLELPLSL